MIENPPSSLLIPQSTTLTVNQETLFDQAVRATLSTVASSSARVYEHTFNAWANWCSVNRIDPLSLIAANVGAFLREQPVSQTTRQRQLSALRKLARVLALDYTDPSRRAAYESLVLLRAPKDNARPERPRSRQALKPSEADKALRAWPEDTLIHKRNRALIALLFLTGLRRSEVASLRWTDVDLEERILHVRHGKGDVARDVAIAGDAAIEALREWQNAQGIGREFIFCPVAKGSKLGPDKGMIPQAIYQVVQATARQSGVAFSPHDARRTLITEALTTGTPLADVKAQAGHSQESTTLRYARPVDAKNRLQRLRLRYG